LRCGKGVERLAWGKRKEAEERESMELRQSTAALRKEKEMYESSELESLRDDDSVRSNSLRRAMSGSSETKGGRRQPGNPPNSRERYASSSPTRHQSSTTVSYATTPRVSRSVARCSGEMAWGYDTRSSEPATAHMDRGAT